MDHTLFFSHILTKNQTQASTAKQCMDMEEQDCIFLLHVTLPLCLNGNMQAPSHGGGGLYIPIFFPKISHFPSKFYFCYLYRLSCSFPPFGFISSKHAKTNPLLSL